MRHLLGFVTLLCALSAAASVEAQLPTLEVGSDAPPLTVTPVQGAPITRFEKGRPYVVEFWATWCLPCRANMPHLTELAKKYAGKLEVLGVSVYEDDQAKVAPFAKGNAKNMGYSVAMDVQKSPTAREGKMSANWIEAAGYSGIPLAFIVDRETKIAWIGHPATMDEALEKVVDGTWDRDRYAAQLKADLQAKEPIYAALVQYRSQMEARHFDAALLTSAQIEKLPSTDRFPEPVNLGLTLALSTFVAKNDMTGWYRTADRFAVANVDNGSALSSLAWQIADPESKLPVRKADVALRLAKRAVEVTERGDASVLDVLAWCYHLAGKDKLAVETERTALKLELDSDTRKQLLANLAKFGKG